MRSSDLSQYEVWAKTGAFKRKVDASRSIMRDASKSGKVLASVSWGKDSICLAHLALDTLGDIPLFHMVSRTALPGDEDVIEYFTSRAVVHVLPPSRTLADSFAILHKWGLSHERDRTIHRKLIQQQKGSPARSWALQHGFTVNMLGFRIKEGGPRAVSLKSRGHTYKHSDGVTMCCPLAYWTARDVWAYIASRGLPYNHHVYDAETHGYTRETIRSSSWLYTDGAGEGYVAWLRTHFPDHYRMLRSEFPRVAMHT